MKSLIGYLTYDKIHERVLQDLILNILNLLHNKSNQGSISSNFYLSENERCLFKFWQTEVEVLRGNHPLDSLRKNLESLNEVIAVLKKDSHLYKNNWKRKLSHLIEIYSFLDQIVKE